MKILFLSNVFPTPREPQRGTFNAAAAKALARDHEVSVIVPLLWTRELPWRTPTAAQEWSHEGIDVTYVPYFYTPKVLQSHYGTFMWWSVQATVKRVLARVAPDVVVGFWAHPDGEAAVRAARLAGVPAVVMVGGSDVLVLGDSPARKLALRRVFDAADAIVAVSGDLKRAVHGFGVPSDKVFVSYRGVDTSRFCAGDRVAARQRLGVDSRSPMLLWVGHMVGVKGLDVLLAAAAHLKSTGQDFTLHLVGDGPERLKVEQMRRSFGLAERVRVVGSVSHSSLPDWYRAADLTVLASHSEGVPNVLLESIACGTRFVSTRVGGVPEIAQPGLDVLAEPGNATDLAAAIASSLSQELLPRRIAPPDDVATAARGLTRILERARQSRAGVPDAASAAVSLEKACI